MPSPKVSARKLSQPGLEVVFDNHDGPQVIQPEKEVVRPHWSAQQQPEKEVAEPLMRSDEKLNLPTRESQTPCRIFGLPRKVFWILALVLALLAIGLGIGLGVGLSSRTKEVEVPASPASTANSTSQGTSEASTPVVAKALQIGGSLDPSYYSTEGVWNGSGLDHNWQSFSSNYGDAPEDAESLVIYYQHRTGAIRWMRYTTEGDWVRGSSESEVVATDAKNSTPISAVSYEAAGTQHRHIFYIDKEYTVRQRSGSNATNAWTDGAINEKNLKTYRGDLIGLHACPSSPDSAVRLWYASAETTFEEYIFSDDEWTWQRSWHNYSGAAGVGCYSWGPDEYTYATFVNLDNVLELWYKEKTAPNPYSWRQTGILIRTLHPSSSVSLSNHFVVLQKHTTASASLQVSKISWNGSNTAWSYDRSFSLESVADIVPGTHITALARFEAGVDTAFVYAQVHGDDVTEFSRPLDGDDGSGWRRRDRAREIRD